MRLVEVAESREVILNVLGAINPIALRAQQGVLTGNVLYLQVAFDCEDFFQRPIVLIGCATADEVVRVATVH